MNHSAGGLGGMLDQSTWEGLVWWVSRLTAIAVIGHLLLAALARASAAARHLTALATLAMMLVAPLATTFLPALSLPVLPARLAALAPPQWAPAVASEARAIPAPSRTLRPGLDLASAAAGAHDLSPIRQAPSRPVAPASGPGWVILALGAVAAGLLMRVACGAFAAAWICRRAIEVESAKWRRELTEVRGRLGVDRAVSLKTSPHVSVPAVSGVFRNTLLIPTKALEWDHDRRWAVLLHEVAHVRRHDALGLQLARFVTAFLWFHPLAWTLARVARRECERACDDAVLRVGVRASDYADHLLSIACSPAGRERWAPPMLAFARRSALEGRLVALLRPDLPREPVSRRAVLTVCAALALLLPFGSVRVVAAPARGGQKSTHESMRTETRTTFAERRAVSTETTFASSKPTPRPSGEVDAELAGSRSGEAWYDRAREWYNDASYAEAAEAYERAAEAGYRPETAWYNAACSYALDGKRLPALKALEQAVDAGFDQADLLRSDDDLNSLRAEPRFRRILEQASRSDGAQATTNSALSEYRALRSSDSDDAEAWKSAGMALLRSGQTEQAADAFEHEARIDGSSSAIYNRACAEAVGGDTEAALATLERAVLAGFGDAKKLDTDTDLISLRRDPRFDRLVQLADDLTLFSSGRSDDDPGSWRDVLLTFERVTREHPMLGRAWFNLGYARLRARQFDGSRDAFARALELDYRKPTTLYNLACVSAQAGDHEAAIRWLEKSQAAGMKLEDIAPGDPDLDPLRSDARFRAMADGWGRGREKNKEKRWKKS